MVSTHFDYIIIGAGCSGLSLAARLIQSGQFHQKKILILDRQPKNLNDRTWCFWQKEKGFFECIVHHQWQQLWLRHPLGKLHLNMGAYTYKMIRGIDFYNHCFQLIHNATNITVAYDDVTSINAQEGIITCTNKQYTAPLIFSSVLLQAPALKPNQFYLLQHFKGWWIETETDFFDNTQADLMNYHTSQQHGCAFVYVLPVSPKKALVELTYFTEKTLSQEQYSQGLTTFIQQQLHLNKYTIAEVEQGIIPMTNMAFPGQQGKVHFIGTAGGQTKASTGYTFQFIQKQTSQIVAALLQQQPLKPIKTPPRFSFYDGVILRVLKEEKLKGADVFYQLFKKNKAYQLLQFLDNETNFLQELQILNSTKKSIFVKAALQQLMP